MSDRSFRHCPVLGEMLNDCLLQIPINVPARQPPIPPADPERQCSEPAPRFPRVSRSRLVNRPEGAFDHGRRIKGSEPASISRASERIRHRTVVNTLFRIEKSGWGLKPCGGKSAFGMSGGDARRVDCRWSQEAARNIRG